MKQMIVLGAQWGDEGKGKLVDALAAQFDAVVRWNGGNNAGHTIMYHDQPAKLHVLPSGIFQKKQLIITQGAVFDPEILVQELQFCKKNKIPIKLLIDYRVNLVMPYHKWFDGASEQWKGAKATGSVKVGIGYCYEDRNNRSGIRCEDLLYPKILKEKIVTLFPLKKAILEKAYGVQVHASAQEVYQRLMVLARVIKPFLGDASSYVSKNIETKRFLFEGAMATMLDGQFGTYPYTVANNTIASALFPSIGCAPFSVSVLGVVKAYTTRVGGGPFPTEQKNATGEKLQKIGAEIAATSGRIRRCGWLDLPILRFAHRLNHFSSLAVTKLDVLSQFDKIPVCTAYVFKNKKLLEYPEVSHEYHQCKPKYTSLPGWKTPIDHCKNFADLPKAAKNYVSFIEAQTKVPVSHVSIGPGREQLLERST